MSVRRITTLLLFSCLFFLSVQSAFAADKLRIGYSGATISNAMLWVTQEGRLFEKNGIDAEVLYLQTTLGQTALIAGEIQMCVYSASLLTPARLQGADVVMLLSFLHKPIYRLVVKPEIRTVADLRGKRVGVTRFGTVSDWTTRLLLSRLGLDRGKRRDPGAKRRCAGAGQFACRGKNPSMPRSCSRLMTKNWRPWVCGYC